MSLPITILDTFDFKIADHKIISRNGTSQRRGPGRYSFDFTIKLDAPP